VLALLISIGAFYGLTLRGGQQWGDDFALYIHHAENLIQGLPYQATGYISNPAAPHIGPPFYPPGLPWMLAPALALFGLNFTVLKLEIIAAFIFGLFFVFLLFRDRLPYAWTLTLVALVGLNPFIWSTRDDILSDLPFLAVSYACMYIIHAVYRRTDGHPPLAYALPFGLAIYLTYSFRPHGILLLPAFVVYDFLRVRRVRLIVVLTGLTAAVAAGIQMAALHGDNRYSLFDFHAGWLATSVIGYIRGYRSFWETGFASPVSYVLVCLALALALYGCWRSIAAGIHIYDLYACFYLILIIPYPVIVYRYLFPLVPVVMLYMLIGLRALSDTLPMVRARAILACALALVALSYGSMYWKSDRGPIRDGLFDSDFADVCRYVRTSTSASSRFLFRKPRVLSLATGRMAATTQDLATPADMWNFIRSIGASYVIVANVTDPEFASDRIYLRDFVAQYRNRLVPAYQNAHYQVLYIEPDRNAARGIR
jgi:hypothetical protein